MIREDDSALADRTWPEVGRRTDRILAVPLGSTEQHGPHLPLSTDTDIATALCRVLAAKRGDVFVAPALPYGSSGEHDGFAGTLSIGLAALETVVLELGRSATKTFAHVLFVSAHGGNAEAVIRAVDRLRYEGRDVFLFQPRWAGDAHAGHTETAMQLALTPERVQMAEAVPGDSRALIEILPLLREGGVRAVTATGILGDPTGATAAHGRRQLDAITADLIAAVGRWRSVARV